MFSFYNIAVSLLMYLLFVIPTRCEGDEKSVIVKDIMKFTKAEAHVMIDRWMNKVLETKSLTPYDFSIEKNYKEALEKTETNVLMEIRNIQNNFINCSYAQIAYVMIKHLQRAFDQLNELTSEEKKSALLPFIGQLVEKSKILWRKAICAVNSVGIKLERWFWMILIYTNTASQVTTKTYPGMTKTMPDETLIKRVTRVQELIREILKQAATNCKQLPSETVWDLVVVDDGFPYTSEIRNSQNTYKCPMQIDKTICDAHIQYVRWFEKFLYRNNVRGVLTYNGFEKFNPEKWLITSPILEKMLVRDVSLNIDWQNVETDIEYYVKCISNDDWLVYYPNIYFDTVSNVMIAVQQATEQVIKQNWINCQQYWRKIENDPETYSNKLTTYSDNCTGIRRSIELIIENMAIQHDKALNKLNQILATKFTMNVDFDIAIDYSNKTFNSQDLRIDFNDKSPKITDYEKYFNDFLIMFSEYANQFPPIHEYIEIFELFKSTYYKT